MDNTIERHGGDAPYLDLKTNRLTESWSHDKIFEAVQTVATDPNSIWMRRHASDGMTSNLFDPSGEPATFNVQGFYDGILIRVGVRPLGEGITTAFTPN